MPTDLGDHFRAIWAKKYLVLLISLLVAAAAYLLSSQQDEVFEASLRLRLAPGEVVSGQRVTETETAFLATSYAELGSGDVVLDPAAEAVGLSVDRLRGVADVAASGTPGFIDVSASAGSAERAEELADAVSQALVDAIQERQDATLATTVAPVQAELDELADELGTLELEDPERPMLEARYDALLQALISRQVRTVDRLEVVSPARSEGAPVSPRPRRDATLAFLLALVINGELVVLLSALGDRLSPENLAEDIAQTTGLPLLARVPGGRRSQPTEAFRELRTNLQFMGGDRSISSVAVVGDAAGVGKTMAALNLARSVASAGLTVVLVDGDLRRPSVHDRLGIPRTPGLTDFIQEGRTDVVRSAPAGEPGTLDVLTSGSPLADPLDLLTTRLRPLIDVLRTSELTVIDTPPLRLFSDGLAIASECDATILVVDVRSTKRREVKVAVERLRQVGANVVGVVANRTEDVRERAYYDVAAKEALGQRAAASAGEPSPGDGGATRGRRKTR